MTTTTTATTTTREYLSGEALTGRMTAREWTEQFWPGRIGCMDDEDAAFAEITEYGHAEARRLNLPHSTTGHYPPVVWELEAA